MNPRRKKPHYEFKVTAPGKIILFGEHSVVYGKTALAASVDVKTTLVFSTSTVDGSESIVLRLPNIGLHLQLNLNGLREQLTDSIVPLLSDARESAFCLEKPEMVDFEKLVMNVRTYMKRNINEKLPPTKENAVTSFLCLLAGMLSSVNVPLISCFVSITSDIQIGAGMGSSSAYNVCIAAAFLNYIRLNALKQLQNPCNISKKGYKHFQYWEINAKKFGNGEIELISKWALLGDKVMHGNPSGIDNAVCSHGTVIEFKKGSRGTCLKMIPDPKHLKVLLVNTKVPRNTKQLVEFVATRRKHFTSVVDPVLDAMDSIALTAAATLRRLGQLKCLCNNENTKSVENISKEIQKLEELTDMNQKLLESLGVSHDSLETICKIAREEGLSAKLTGAGGGGFAFVIIPHETKLDRVTRATLSLEEHGYCTQEVVLGGPGVRLEHIIEVPPERVDSEEVKKDIDIPSISLSGTNCLPDYSCSLGNSPYNSPQRSPVPLSVQNEEEKWPGKIDCADILRRVNQYQAETKKMKRKEEEKERKELPVSYDNWRKVIKSVWGRILDEAQSQNFSSNNEVLKTGEEMFPNVAEVIALPLASEGKKSQKKRITKKIPAKAFEKQNLVDGSMLHKTRVNQSSSFVNPLKWLSEKFPVDTDRKEEMRLFRRIDMETKGLLMDDIEGNICVNMQREDSDSDSDGTPETVDGISWNTWLDT